MEHFQTYLQQDFAKRHAKNRNYSIRAYAKHLGIYHATLSALLSGRRRITEKTAELLSPRLGMGPTELSDLVAGRKTSPYHILQQDLFNAMADWYYDAILELTLVKNFQIEPKTVSKALDIALTEAKMAIDTLVRLGLMQKNKAGRFDIIYRNSTTILEPNFTSVANRKYQKEILEKASEAVDKFPVERRNHTSSTLAIDKNDLAKVKEIIRKCRREIAELTQRKDAELNEVYQLQISFFPLTEISEGEEK